MTIFFEFLSNTLDNDRCTGFIRKLLNFFVKNDKASLEDDLYIKSLGIKTDYLPVEELNYENCRKYLPKLFYENTKNKLNLTNPKTLSEKVQWLKLNDSLPIKTQLTDKVLVRDWIAKQIGDEYLKPVLQICDRFDDIDFDSLPESFIIKCNHGAKCVNINKIKYLLYVLYFFYNINLKVFCL